MEIQEQISISWPPDADAGTRTCEPYDDVDPMPDYENVLTD